MTDGVNLRTDAYGGSIANRARFLEEALDACIAACGAERVGVRLSPASHWQDIQDSDPLALYTHVGRMLAGKAGLAYLHVVEPRDTGLGAPPTDPVDLQLTASFFRTTCGFPGAVLSAGGHSMESGQQFLQSGACDAVVYGRHYISNPDLVERFKAAADSGKEPVLTPYDRATFYASGPEGCECAQCATAGCSQGAHAAHLSLSYTHALHTPAQQIWATPPWHREVVSSEWFQFQSTQHCVATLLGTYHKS